MRKDNSILDRELKNIKIGFYTAIGIFIGTVIFYFYNFNSNLSSKQEVWGFFGDYIGGLGGTLVALFALYYLVHTLITQKKELRETVKALKASHQEQDIQNKLSNLLIQTENIKAKINFVSEQLHFQHQRLIHLTSPRGDHTITDFDGETIRYPHDDWKKRVSDLVSAEIKNVKKYNNLLNNLEEIKNNSSEIILRSRR